ncbi:hypothetical protein [Metapseudomonas otitidis]|uniref:hypothetical protein n=1 Tax=Metapseudomonas otitidis TaxID=319939 RepID=UPI003CF71D4D
MRLAGIAEKTTMSKHSLTLRDQTTEFLLYTAPNGAIKVEVLLSNESIWLTQKRMAELFGVGFSAISKHLKDISTAASWWKRWLFPFWKQPLNTAQ